MPRSNQILYRAAGTRHIPPINRDRGPVVVEMLRLHVDF